MVCNDLVMPVLLRLTRLRAAAAARPDAAAARHPPRRDRRASLLLGYVYFRLAGEAYALVSIGLISFAAVAQFAPAILGGMYWKGRHARRRARRAVGGFARLGSTRCCCRPWRKSGWLPDGFVEDGPFGIALLSPSSCSASRAWTTSPMRCSGACWSTSAPMSACRCWRAPEAPRSKPGAAASSTSSARRRAGGDVHVVWRGTRPVPRSRRRCSRRFLGAERARGSCSRIMRGDAALTSVDELPADADLVHFVERALAGAIGSASARVMVASVVQEEPLGDRRGDRDPRRGVAGASPTATQLEQKSRELELPPPSCAPPTSGCRSSTAEGRLHVHGDPRAAHAADLDPRLLRDILHDDPTWRPAERAAVPADHRPGERAADAA